MSAVEHLHAHQHVRDRCLKPDELNTLPSQSPGPGVDEAVFDQRIGEFLHRGRCDLVDLVRKPEHDRQAHAGKHRRSPKQLVAAEPNLVDLQIGGADLMRACD